MGECLSTQTLCRAATRAEEELSPYLSSNKRAYVFGTLAAQAARLAMWLLPELRVRLEVLQRHVHGPVLFTQMHVAHAVRTDAVHAEPGSLRQPLTAAKRCLQCHSKA